MLFFLHKGSPLLFWTVTDHKYIIKMLFFFYTKEAQVPMCMRPKWTSQNEAQMYISKWGPNVHFKMRPNCRLKNETQMYISKWGPNVHLSMRPRCRLENEAQMYISVWGPNAHLQMRPKCRLKYEAQMYISKWGPNVHLSMRPNCRLKNEAQKSISKWGPNVHLSMRPNCRLKNEAQMYISVWGPNVHLSMRPKCTSQKEAQMYISEWSSMYISVWGLIVDWRLNHNGNISETKVYISKCRTSSPERQMHTSEWVKGAYLWMRCKQPIAFKPKMTVACNNVWKTPKTGTKPPSLDSVQNYDGKNETNAKRSNLNFTIQKSKTLQKAQSPNYVFAKIHKPKPKPCICHNTKVHTNT